MLAMLNGNFLSHSESRSGLAGLLRCSQFGDGLFETMFSRRGEIHLRQRHMARLARGLQVLQIPMALGELESELDSFLQSIRGEPGYQRVKWLVTRSGTTAGYAVGGAETARLITASQLVPAEYADASCDVVECSVRMAAQPLLAGLKHCNRLEQVLASLDVQAQGFDEGILFDQRGVAVEAVSANLFVVDGDRLLTPKLDQAGVAGVLREQLIEVVAPELGIEVQQVDLQLQQLMDADALLLCNAVRGCTRVSSLTARDGNTVQYARSGVADAVALQLQQSMLATGRDAPLC